MVNLVRNVQEYFHQYVDDLDKLEAEFLNNRANIDKTFNFDYIEMVSDISEDDLWYIAERFYSDLEEIKYELPEFYRLIVDDSVPYKLDEVI